MTKIKKVSFIAKVSKHGSRRPGKDDFVVGRVASKELIPFIGERVRVDITLLKVVEA